MEKQKLTRWEKNLLEEFRRGNYRKVKLTKKRRQEYVEAAKSTRTFVKDQRITLRLNGKDLSSLKRQAYKAGKKYQTFIGDILHEQAIRGNKAA